MAQLKIKSVIKVSAATIIGTLILSGCFVDRPAYDSMSTEQIFQEVRICGNMKSTEKVRLTWMYREDDRYLAVSQHQDHCKNTSYEVDSQLHRYFITKKWDLGPINEEK